MVDSGGIERLKVGKPWQKESLELLCVQAGLLIQAGVVDGQPRRAGQRDNQGFVVRVEQLPIASLGDEQVSVDLAADANRSS
ncbi:hypothetical protein ACWGQ5_18405 [Streptomyces sp. NPDC055722]